MTLYEHFLPGRLKYAAIEKTPRGCLACALLPGVVLAPFRWRDMLPPHPLCHDIVVAILPYCLSNGRKPGAPPVGAYCSLAGPYQIPSLSRDWLDTVLPCLASPSLPLQNLKSGHNIYIPTMDFLEGGGGGGYRVAGHPRECLGAPDVATSAPPPGLTQSATIVTLMRGGGTRWVGKG